MSTLYIFAGYNWVLIYWGLKSPVEVISQGWHDYPNLPPALLVRASKQSDMLPDTLPGNRPK